MDATLHSPDKMIRIERQIRRLRDLLASAWAEHYPPATIRRIESLIERRWNRVDRSGRMNIEPQPA